MSNQTGFLNGSAYFAFICDSYILTFAVRVTETTGHLYKYPPLYNSQNNYCVIEKYLKFIFLGPLVFFFWSQ